LAEGGDQSHKQEPQKQESGKTQVVYRKVKKPDADATQEKKLVQQANYPVKQPTLDKKKSAGVVNSTNRFGGMTAQESD
jgi:hypothetical protein